MAEGLQSARRVVGERVRERRDPEDALPDDPLYRTFLPMWRFWLSLAAVGLFLLRYCP